MNLPFMALYSKLNIYASLLDKDQRTLNDLELLKSGVLISGIIKESKNQM